MKYVVDNIAAKVAPGGLSLLNASTLAEVSDERKPYPLPHFFFLCLLRKVTMLFSFVFPPRLLPPSPHSFID
jgi:hypothetical protein